jgi:hypothetical protein
VQRWTSASAGCIGHDLAYGIVVWYVGANLMAHLEPDGRRTDELFVRAREWAPLLGSFLPPP